MVFHKKQVFLLHGWAIDPHNEKKWTTFIIALERKGISAQFIPLPGLTTPLNEVWDLNDYVEFTLQQMTGKNNILIGHSFGGQIASRFAAKYPEMVKAIVLIDSSGIRPNDFFSKLKRNVFKFIAKVGKRLVSSAVLRKWLYKFAREKDYYQANETLRQTMANVISTDISEDLKKITQHTLILWGEKDKTTPPSIARQFKRLIKNAELFFIQGAKHSPQFTHPDMTAEKTAVFLSQVEDS